MPAKRNAKPEARCTNKRPKTVASTLEATDAIREAIDADDVTSLGRHARDGAGFDFEIRFNEQSRGRAVDCSGSPLHYAARQGSRRCLEMLVKSGSDVNAENSNGDTALCEAAKNAHVECASVLLDQGAIADHANKSGLTPLLLAATIKRVPCMNTNTSKNLRRHELVSLLVENKADVRHASQKGNTAIHLSLGSTYTMAFLIGLGADPNAANAAGSTPLHNCWFSHESVKWLVQNGAAASVDQTNARGETPVLTHMRGAYDFYQQAGPQNVQLLLARAANKNPADNDGKSLLHYAAEKKAFELVEALFKLGVDPTPVDSAGNSPLHVCAGHPRVKMLQLLLDQGCDASRVNRHGKTAADVAAEKGRKNACRLLTKAAQKI